MLGAVMMPGNISGYDRNIYHLLGRAICQSVAVSEIVDFDVLDVIPVGYVNFSAEFRRRDCLVRRRFRGSRRRTSLIIEEKVFVFSTSMHLHSFTVHAREK